jgi:hypothetical protein
MLTLAMAPLSALDLALVYEYLSRLDLTVVASCCSLQLDPIAARGTGFAGGPRVIATFVAVIGTVLSIGAALFAARSPTRVRVAAAGVVTLLAIPAALAASVLEVAPHAFEVPQHVCPFCLLRSDVLAIGYPLYGALLLAAIWAGGAVASALLARGDAPRAALAPFARLRLTRGAIAWGLALAVGVAPLIRYSIVASGAPLFP